jgi:hypothetical protein
MRISIRVLISFGLVIVCLVFGTNISIGAEWVLWRGYSVTVIGKAGVEAPDKTWNVMDAYQSKTECSKILTKKVKSEFDSKKAFVKDKSEGVIAKSEDGSSIMYSYKDKFLDRDFLNRIIIDYKCLPASVDPRRK